MKGVGCVEDSHTPLPTSRPMPQQSQSSSHLRKSYDLLLSMMLHDMEHLKFLSAGAAALPPSLLLTPGLFLEQVSVRNREGFQTVQALTSKT